MSKKDNSFYCSGCEYESNDVKEKPCDTCRKGMAQGGKVKIRKSILSEADDLVSLDRQQQYGHPAQNFKDIAKIASAILGIEMTAEECVVVMVAVKLGRLKFKYKHDSIVDLAGYLKVWDMIKEAENAKR